MATREEVLHAADIYRKLRGEILGQKASDFPISDEWGHTKTIAGLLIQNPAWQSHLTDDMNDEVYSIIRNWLNDLPKGAGLIENSQVGV